MLFNASYYEPKGGSFLFSGEMVASCASCLCKDIFSEMWNNFSFGFSSITFKEDESLKFTVGECEIPELCGEDFAISIEKCGIAILAKGECELRHAFFTLLDKIKISDEDDSLLSIECALIRDSAKIGMRMVHFCVFPETELYELRRFIRFSAALRLTHVIIEFWGMLKYDCMPELAWAHAYSKDDLRPIIKEARDLGIELIPMFNHWGHAAGSRVRHGKHVVLDQNPALQSYFSEDGWCWDIKKPKVKELLSKVRDELFDLFDDATYFHVGCDEAYGYDLTAPGAGDLIVDYLNEICESINSVGKRMICWGDMFLYKDPSYNQNNRYECNCPTEELQKYLLNKLDKRIIIGDWQYTCNFAPIETSEVIKNYGFKVMICPWDSAVGNVLAAVNTAKDKGLYGIIHTTWHTLSMGTPMITMMAIGCYGDASGLLYGKRTVMTSALLRKVYPSCGDYSRSGWSKKQINDITS